MDPNAMQIRGPEHRAVPSGNVMSNPFSNQGAGNTAAAGLEQIATKQTASSTSARPSKSTSVTSRKYKKNVRELFAQGQDLQMDPIFHLFRKFPIELRLKVWKNAIHEIPSRIIYLQPFANAGIPGVLQACRESRDEAKKTYTIVKSGQPHLPFTLAINNSKDTIYLNRNFKDKVVERFPTALFTAIHFYKDVMKDTKKLAMNLEDAWYLTTAYRDVDGKRDLWKTLDECCPKLEEFQLVIDGPAKGRTVQKFRTLHIIRNHNRVEFLQRHPHLVLVKGSGVVAERKGYCKNVSKTLASIDHVKQLPVREGERGSKDGSGFYDAYGICDYLMKWGSNGEPIKLRRVAAGGEQTKNKLQKTKDGGV